MTLDESDLPVTEEEMVAVAMAILVTGGGRDVAVEEDEGKVYRLSLEGLAGILDRLRQDGFLTPEDEKQSHDPNVFGPIVIRAAEAWLARRRGEPG